MWHIIVATKGVSAPSLFVGSISRTDLFELFINLFLQLLVLGFYEHFQVAKEFSVEILIFILEKCLQIVYALFEVIEPT